MTHDMAARTRSATNDVPPVHVAWFFIRMRRPLKGKRARKIGTETMLQYDLSATAVAHSDESLRPPSEAELLAITVALMLLSDCAYSDLRGRSLTLTRRNCRRIAELIEERTPPLAREFGAPLHLRRRLADLVGLSIACECP